MRFRWRENARPSSDPGRSCAGPSRPPSGNFVHEIDGARAFVCREVCPGEGDDVLSQIRRGRVFVLTDTTDRTSSPHSSFGAPMVQTSRTAGCWSRMLSISCG